jgi:flagellar basal-body rod protein FlgC
MDYLAAFAIGAAGMNLEKARAEMASLNLANASVAAAPGTQAWRRATLSVEAGAFPEQLARLQQAVPRIVGTVYGSQAPRMVHEPGNPQADAQGYVAYPRITVLDEMLTIMQASRAYQANVSAVSAARSMAQKALEIGGNR